MTESTTMARVEAFGYRYTKPPADATLVLDVRDITNPHASGGSDESKRARVLRHPLSAMYIEQGVLHLLGNPDGFVAVGCSFGRHRSVAIARAIWKRYRQERKNV